MRLLIPAIWVCLDAQVPTVFRNPMGITERRGPRRALGREAALILLGAGCIGWWRVR
jgi:hypothetical protein